MRVLIFLFTFLKFSSSSVYKSVNKNTDDKIIQEEIDDDLSDFFDEVANAQEVLEVPIEYEDDNKPSKTPPGFQPKYIISLYRGTFVLYFSIISVPIRDVWAVRDGKAELPCDINPPDPTDQVYLVLWYRDLAGKPLYSYDLRWELNLLQYTWHSLFGSVKSLGSAYVCLSVTPWLRSCVEYSIFILLVYSQHQSPTDGAFKYFVLFLYHNCFRGKPPQAGKHWSAEPPFGFGQRARFRVPAAESFTALVIKDVTLLDEGVYRCRVDYRNSPTRNMKLNLTVVGKKLLKPGVMLDN